MAKYVSYHNFPLNVIQFIFTTMIGLSLDQLFSSIVQYKRYPSDKANHSCENKRIIF